MFVRVVARKMPINGNVGCAVVRRYPYLRPCSTPSEIVSVILFKAFPFLKNLCPVLWAICRS